MSAFTERINASIKEAMKAKDKDRLATLRDIKSKLLLEVTSVAGSVVSDEIGAKICLKLHKQRKECQPCPILKPAICRDQQLLGKSLDG
jgi:uncharacterized protein YqeY